MVTQRQKFSVSEIACLQQLSVNGRPPCMDLIAIGRRLFSGDLEWRLGEHVVWPRSFRLVAKIAPFHVRASGAWPWLQPPNQSVWLDRYMKLSRSQLFRLGERRP